MTRRRRPTPEDLALWRRATRDVAPMLPQPQPTEPDPAPPKKPSQPEETAKRRTAAARPASRPPPRTETGDAPLTGRVIPGLDQRSADRLRQGRIEIEARIDLHGMRQAEAHHALAAFVDHNHRHGRRMLLVITGKGALAEGRGVLRSQVPRWLSDPPLRDKVLAQYPARQKDGGDGALYVLLKRRRVP